MVRKIDISHKTIFFLTGFLALIWALYIIRDLILMLFVSVILVSAFSPLVDHLVKLKLPKPLSIAVVYIVVILCLAGIITLGLSPITTQTSSLILKLQDSISSSFTNFHVDQSTIRQQLPDLSRNLLSVTSDIFQSFVTVVLIAVISFYLLLDKDNLEKRLASLFGSNEQRVRKLINKIEFKLGAWLRGQMLLSLIVAVLIYVGLTVLGVDYALPLALISGLLEVIPIVGPILSSIPGIAIALAVSPVLATFTGALYLVVQQVESHIIVPQVMKRAVGLNPLIVILAIAVGSRLLGIAGALLAVPITVMGQIIVEDYLNGE